MKNRVRVSATFSFRGETFRPELVLDLDELPPGSLEPEALYPLLASANGIDPYSYEYEVLEVTPLEFDRPEGMVAEYLHEGRLDFPALRQALADARLRNRLEAIAHARMGVKKLEEIPGLEAALRAAWEEGRNDKGLIPERASSHEKRRPKAPFA